MALDTSPEAPAPVRQIAQAITGWVDRLGAVWVEGQVAQVSRRQGMQTVFLVLRDPIADISISVTCSRLLFDSLNPPLVEGASIVVHAKPSYYAPRGTLSLQARDIRMVGLGELLARLERRRQLLAAEGLFAAELKRPLPFLPTKVGLVTAPSSAAERDVLEVARRRWPAVTFEVAYAAMQGTRSVLEVIEGLERLDKDPDVDVIVIARGGGSVEDLLPFSDEALIRAVHKARTPVVSAIGHEPDQPLLDLVADVRAATPPSGSCPTWARSSSASPWRGSASGARSTGGSPPSSRGSTCSGPALPWPTRGAFSTTAPTRSAGWSTGRGAASATSSTVPPTRSATTAPGPAHCRPSRRWSAATPSSSPPTGTS